MTAAPLEIPDVIRRYLAERELGAAVSTEGLKGGVISLTRRIKTERGKTFVLKQATDIPPDMYRLEASGLATLAEKSPLHLPEVLFVNEENLLLEDLGSRPPEKGFWTEYGHAVARLHQVKGDRFGFDHGNYLGRLPMTNTWSDDGHEFFINWRMLRFLEEPNADQTLTTSDRKAVERIASRLRELIPEQPASLLHGDLWLSNMLVGPDGEPAAIDPAVYYGWAEADLSMSWLERKVPMEFFDGYRDYRPLEVGWEERLDLLLVKEHLCMIAHFGDEYGSLAKLRVILDRFA